MPTEKVPESVAFSLEEIYGEDPREDAADELLHAFEEAVIREAYEEEVNNLRRVEAAGDAALIQRAQARCKELSERLAALGN